MEDAPITISGRVLELADRGWTEKEISKELKVPLGRVKTVMKKANSRSEDSRRLFAVYEGVMEALAILREVKGVDPLRLAARLKMLEKVDIPRKIGATIESSERDTCP